MPGRSVVVRLSAEVSGYVAGMTRAGAATQRAMAVSEASVAKANRANERHQKLLGAVGTAAKYSGIAVAGGLILAAKEAADFNEKMALVQSLSHANRREMVQLAGAAKHTGTQFGYTATSVADGEAEMIKAGVSLKDIMGGGLRGTLSLAAAGQTDVATATEIASAAMVQFNKHGSDIPHIADLLAAGADKALGSVTDLGYGLSQAGTTAHQAGVSIEGTVGTLSAFANAGLTGERGGTIFKQMLLQLENPTHNARQLMDQYGISLYTASGRIKSMPALAANLQHSLERLTPAQRNAALGTIFGSRAIQGANILMAEGSKGISSWIRKVNDQGFAADQARGKLNSLKGDMSKLKAEGVNALIELGQGTQSPLRHFVQDVTGGIHHIVEDGSLKRWGDETGQALETVVNGAKPVVSAVGSIVSAFNSLPAPVKTGLATAGLTALVARKVPGVGAAAAGGALGGRAGGVVPVFVTNAGFGGPGSKVKGAPGTVLADGERAAKSGGLRGVLSKAGGAVNIPNIVATVLTVQGIKNAGSPTGAAGAGAAGGAFLGGRIGGIPGAVGGAVIGGLVGIDNYTDKTQSTFTKAMKDRGKNVRELVDSYHLLQKRQHELYTSGDAFMPPAAQMDADKMKLVLRQIGKETGLTGKQLKAFANGSGGIGTTWTVNDELKQVAFGADKAGVSARRLSGMFNSLPSQVVTKFLTPGAVKSAKDARDLGQQYGLTPRQVRTLIQLLGFRDAEDKVAKHKHSIKDLNGQTAKPRVTPADADFEPKINQHKKSVHTLGVQQAKPKVSVNDQASGTLNRIGGAVAGLNGRHATVTITTNRVTHYSTTGSTKGKPLPDPSGISAAGNIFRAFADGDVANGHQALIERMPKFRMWAEPETKGESYIPLANDWRRPRAISIWEQTGRLLGQYGAGGVARFAGGGGVDDLHYRHNIRGVTRELGKLTAELKKTRESRKEYSKSTAQAYVTDPFGGTLGGFDSQIAYETRRITGARADLRTLRAHGLNGPLYKNLAASGNATLIDQFSHLTRAQIAARERAYRGHNREDTALGLQAATSVYSTRTHELTDEIRRLRHQLHRLKGGSTTNIRHAVIRDSESKGKAKSAAHKARHGR